MNSSLAGLRVPEQWKIEGVRLSQADVLSSLSTCSRRQVGAVLVSADNRIISEGYNGAAPKRPHCVDGGCPRGLLSYDEVPKDADYNQFPCVAIHAEANAIIRANASEAVGGTLYVTQPPCQQCQNMIRAARISTVMWIGDNGETVRWIVEREFSS